MWVCVCRWYAQRDPVLSTMGMCVRVCLCASKRWAMMNRCFRNLMKWMQHYRTINRMISKKGKCVSYFISLCVYFRSVSVCSDTSAVVMWYHTWKWILNKFEMTAHQPLNKKLHFLSAWRTAAVAFEIKAKRKEKKPSHASLVPLARPLFFFFLHAQRSSCCFDFRVKSDVTEK